MSHMKSILKNKAAMQNAINESKHEGGINLLIVSPERGNGSEPVFIKLAKDEVKSDAATVFLKFLKDNKMPGNHKGWAFTFDGIRKWHQIDNEGHKCDPTPLHITMCPTCTCNRTHSCHDNQS